MAPVTDVAQALDNPFVAEREGIVDFAYPDGRKARLIANPIRCAGAELPARAAPALGADTDALLKELGYDAARLRRCAPQAPWDESGGVRESRIDAGPARRCFVRLGVLQDQRPDLAGLAEDEASQLFERLLRHRLGRDRVLHHAEALDVAHLE